MRHQPAALYIQERELSVIYRTFFRDSCAITKYNLCGILPGVRGNRAFSGNCSRRSQTDGDVSRRAVHEELHESNITLKTRRVRDFCGISSLGTFCFAARFSEGERQRGSHAGNVAGSNQAVC